MIVNTLTNLNSYQPIRFLPNIYDINQYHRIMSLCPDERSDWGSRRSQGSFVFAKAWMLFQFVPLNIEYLFYSLPFTYFSFMILDTKNKIYKVVTGELERVVDKALILSLIHTLIIQVDFVSKITLVFLVVLFLYLTSLISWA